VSDIEGAPIADLDKFRVADEAARRLIEGLGRDEPWAIRLAVALESLANEKRRARGQGPIPK
jgi:hypothetical protein